MKKALLALAITSSITSCGSANSASTSSAKSLPGPLETMLGRTKYTVQAVMINEGSQSVTVALLNNGPHGGGCDSKNYVPFEISSKAIKTVSDTWYCETDQKFSVLIKHPKGNLQIEGASANIICNDDGCRKLDVN